MVQNQEYLHQNSQAVQWNFIPAESQVLAQNDSVH